MTAPDIYELVATNAFTARGLYLSHGYWERALTIDHACEARADLVAEIGPADEIVDVGFGFARKFAIPPRSIMCWPPPASRW